MIYFGTTEITNIDNLVPQTGLDITDLWFGSTNVYTVWATYEDALPATISANGDDMRQYQIYGNTGGVGDRTANLFDYSKADKNTYLGLDNVTGDSDVTDTSDYININIFSYGLLKSYKNGEPLNQNVRVFCFYDSQKNFLGRQYSVSYLPDAIKDGVIISIPSNAEFVRFSYDKSYEGEVVFFASNSAIAAPATYIPYGYEVDMSVSDGTSDTTTPIYIGSDPLEKDEYVDYQEQKVYRMINGSLTPTDPPTPLPALPTCEGTEEIDYAGQSQAVPEKVLLKYRKEGY